MIPGENRRTHSDRPFRLSAKAASRPARLCSPPLLSIIEVAGRWLPLVGAASG